MVSTMGNCRRPAGFGSLATAVQDGSAACPVLMVVFDFCLLAVPRADIHEWLWEIPLVADLSPVPSDARVAKVPCTLHIASEG